MVSIQKVLEVNRQIVVIGTPKDRLQETAIIAFPQVQQELLIYFFFRREALPAARTAVSK
jgi:hypothetical protein